MTMMLILMLNSSGQIMELFEVPPDGVVSRKAFVDRVVVLFVQRRSLQLTLGDYEVGVRSQNRSGTALAQISLGRKCFHDSETAFKEHDTSEAAQVAYIPCSVIARRTFQVAFACVVGIKDLSHYICPVTQIRPS